MLDYNTLVELVERIHKNIGVGSTVVLKGETADIKNLSKSTINKLKCGDIVVKKTGNQKHAYIVTYKEEKQGICLTYIDADCIETVSYDYTNGNWVYNSTDVTSIPVLKDKQDALISGVNIKTLNGNSLLGSGDITLDSKSYTHNITLDKNYYSIRFTIINDKAEPLTSTEINTYLTGIANGKTIPAIGYDVSKASNYKVIVVFTRVDNSTNINTINMNTGSIIVVPFNISNFTSVTDYVY